MKIKVSRLLSGVMAVLLLSVLCLPSFAAADPDPTDSRGNFYDWLVNQGGSFVGNRPAGSAGGGRYSKEDYDSFVSTLPAPVYTSAGKLIWQPKFSDFDSHSIFNGTYFSNFPYDTDTTQFSVLSDGSGFCVATNRASGNWNLYFSSCKFTPPVLGVYQLIESPWVFGSSIEDLYYSSSSFVVKNTDDGKLSFGVHTPEYIKTYGSAVLYVYFPVFEITPVTAISGDTYNVNTRPTTITGGNYGVVGDDGTINTVTNNNQIINETTNNYYNPATGQTSTITDWSYNYENRTYDLTLDTGDKVSVEYGDQNITITENTVVEGDTIVNNYIIYYMIEGSGSGSDDPAACTHDWQETSRTEPICTASGRVLYTCSLCGETRISTLPALGHDWEVVRAVPTEYDENGVLTQEGYTLYECTRCGAQYKDVDITGPPDVGTNDGGLLEFLNGIIKYLSDNLSGAVELLQRFFSEIPKLFNGFTEFLVAMFPYLPDDIIFLFTFGIAALVFVGIIKAIRRWR